VVTSIKTLVCELPAQTGVPLSRWSAPELVETIARGVVDTISASTVRRWLAANVLKPWQHRTWIYPRDPGFAAKAAGHWTSTTGTGTANRWWTTTS
jgi:hypothetical protein